MPVVFRLEGVRVRFFSNEGDPREPVHIHVTKNGSNAKPWVSPAVEFAYNHGFDATDATLDPAPWSSSAVSRSRMPRMTISPRALGVEFDEDQMWVRLEDGRTLGIPLVWFPRLLHGSADERRQVFISPSGLHWEALDEDVSIAGLLAGRGDMTQGRATAA